MCQKRVKLREETNADFCHSLLENPHPERQQEQLVASLHGKPNPANPGKFSLGEGGRDPDEPGPPLTCAGPGWSRVKAQEKVIKALSSLSFPGSDTRSTVGHFSLLSAEEIKNNELLAHPPAHADLYLHTEIKSLGRQSQAHPMDLRQAPHPGLLEVSPQCQDSRAEPQRVLEWLMAGGQRGV